MTAKPHSINRFFHLALTAMLLSAFLTSCAPFLSGLNFVNQDSVTGSAAPMAEVAFSVTVPGPEDQEIYLEVLDEVTGLALNPVRYAMENQGDSTYTLKLPVTVGSLLKYRYVRGGEGGAIEQTAKGQTVRYRTFYVSGASLISRDQVAGWPDLPYEGQTGQLHGVITEAGSGAPLVNLVVTASGQQTLTAADGSFIINSLPPGEHTVTVFSLNGEYRPFQQGAVIVEGAHTPADIDVARANLVNVTFVMTPPSGFSVGLPVRLVGSIYSLGNTYADLEGGLSVLASRAPQMTLLEDGRYTLTLRLPVGLDLRYKYTLGDGFWNSEQTKNGHFYTRQLIVPDTDITVNDTVEAFTAGNKAAITFTVKVPENTPAEDTISIQFNPFTWTPPIPMWPVGEHEWVYILQTPLHLMDRFSYRICRNDQCDIATEPQTVGLAAGGFEVSTSKDGQVIEHTVTAWHQWNPDPGENMVVPPVQARSRDFWAGVQLSVGYDPSWQPYLSQTINQVQQLGANYLILTPTWSYRQPGSLELEPLPGSDMLIPDFHSTASEARRANLHLAVYPHSVPRSGSDPIAAVVENPGAWNEWFDSYRRFILHHADLAEQAGAEAFILGERSLSQGLMYGTGTSSQTVEMDYDARWMGLIADIRARFSGEILWAVQFEGTISPIPAWINQVDRIYLEWTPAVPEGAAEDVQAELNRQLLEDIAEVQEHSLKPIILALTAPSVAGANNGCVQTDQGCLSPAALDQPNPGLALNVDVQAQASLVQAVLTTANPLEWVSGFVTTGYSPAVALQDVSNSVRGKPAGDLLWYWYPRLTGAVQ